MAACPRSHNRAALGVKSKRSQGSGRPLDHKWSQGNAGTQAGLLKPPAEPTVVSLHTGGVLSLRD